MVNKNRFAPIFKNPYMPISIYGHEPLYGVRLSAFSAATRVDLDLTLQLDLI